MASGFTFYFSKQHCFFKFSQQKSFVFDKSYSISSFAQFSPKLSWKQKIYTNYVL